MSFSASLNSMLGDTTGRTICLRTTQGFKKSLNLQKVNNEQAEKIVHGIMIVGAVCLISALIWYVIGKNDPKTEQMIARLK